MLLYRFVILGILTKNCLVHDCRYTLQLQVSLQNDIQQPDSGIDTSSLDNGVDDDIDAALSELQITLEGPNGRSKSNDITHIPELTDYLRFLK